MGPQVGDPRLLQPQCSHLTPVETVHRNPWFSVRKRGGFFAVEYNNPQVVVLPVIDDSAVVMVRQERPLIADMTLELPAGGVRQHEKPERAAARELREETGIGISDLKRFRQVPPLCVTPRYPFFTHIFKINLTRTEFAVRANHDNEIQSVESVSFEALAAKIISGEIYLSLPIAILTRYVLLDK
jgi:8-oxo-dGTP pyrophosphatase MutT (NUDIX family)